jgi:hypothetical protein
MQTTTHALTGENDSRYLFRVLSFVAEIGGQRARAAIRSIFPQVSPVAADAGRAPSFDYDPAAPGLLEWQVVQAAVDRLKLDAFVFHAGAVAHEGRGCLLPGRSGSGKTTLTAALVASGFTYLSDELGIVNPADAELIPFPKNMTIKAGSREVLAHSYPQLAALDALARPTGEEVWHLPPPPDAWPHRAVRLEAVVFPHYRPTGPTTLTPLARIDALPRLLDHLFDLGDADHLGMGRLIAAMQGADCYDLAVSDLDDATRLMLDLLGN